MATMAQVRLQAKRAGVSPADIRSAESVAELQRLIKRHGSDGRRTTVKKSATVKKSTARKASATKTAGRKSAPATGRNSGAAKRQTPAKAKPAPARSNGYEAKGGRNVLEGVDFGDTDGWNARPGSAPDRIIKALKRFRGNREKVLEFLLPEIGDFVKAKRRDGSKWARGEREKMLAYRIARTAWDFALKTGQHEKAENRVEYGTGGTGAGIWKPARKAKAAAKTTRTTKQTPKPRTTKAQPKPKRQTTTRRTTTRKGTTTRRKAVRARR
jgi:hypothetical protein